MYFLCLSVLPADTVSYRRTDRGSFLIEYTIDAVRTYAHKDHIEELFRLVSIANTHLGSKLHVVHVRQHCV